jgi:hypothetical protein
MSFAFLNDVYENKLLTQTENDYNEIVNNLLGINNEKKIKKEKDPKKDYNYTRKTEVKDFTNEVINKNNIDINDIEKTSKYIMNKYDVKNTEKKEKEPSIKDCEDFLKHLERCQRCRFFLIKKLNLDKNKDEINNEKYLDIVIFALSGIFILFLLDIILDFGKNFKK